MCKYPSMNQSIVFHFLKIIANFRQRSHKQHNFRGLSGRRSMKILQISSGAVLHSNEYLIFTIKNLRYIKQVFACKNRRRYTQQRASQSVEVIQFVFSFASLVVTRPGEWSRLVVQVRSRYPKWCKLAERRAVSMRS